MKTRYIPIPKSEFKINLKEARKKVGFINAGDYIMIKKENLQKLVPKYEYERLINLYDKGWD